MAAFSSVVSWCRLLQLFPKYVLTALLALSQAASSQPLSRKVATQAKEDLHRGDAETAAVVPTESTFS